MAGKYESKVLEVMDEKTGMIDIPALERELNALADDGWRLIAAFSDNTHQNHRGVPIGAIKLEKNPSIAQNIFVLEREK